MSAVAASVDASMRNEFLGSIAGDDTLLIIARNEESGNCRKIDSIISVGVLQSMLNQLVRNVAVIDKLDINLHDGVKCAYR